jgi:hypothetical protein
MGRLTAPLVAAALAAAAVAGLLWAGRVARDSLARSERHTLPVTAIDVPAPPGGTREQFLDEVQYLGALPDRVSPLDPELPATLTNAFARHPWVVRVNRVEAGPGPALRADVVFRVPVLAVPLADRFAAVDVGGVRLPVGAPTAGLPRLSGEVPPPAGPAGAKWGDPRVHAAASVAAALEGVSVSRLEPDGDGWRLLLLDGARVIWGRPPGAEKEGEPSSARKVERLRAAAGRAHGLDLRSGG